MKMPGSGIEICLHGLGDLGISQVERQMTNIPAVQKRAKPYGFDVIS